MALKNIVSKECLHQMYIVDRMTSRDIAKELNVSFRTVLRRLHAFNLHVRNSGYKAIDELQDYNWLKSEYVDNNRSTIDIAKQLNTQPTIISHWLKRHGIKARPRNQHQGVVWSAEVRLNMSKAKKGKLLRDKNPNWRGAKVNENIRLRASTQSKNWSLQVRERDGHKCVKCNSTNKLHAHHIKSWKAYPELRYDLNNGITLCVKCHQIEHGFKFKDWVVNDELPRALDT